MKHELVLRGEVGARAWRVCGQMREGGWVDAGCSRRLGESACVVKPSKRAVVVMGEPRDFNFQRAKPPLIEALCCTSTRRAPKTNPVIAAVQNVLGLSARHSRRAPSGAVWSFVQPHNALGARCPAQLSSSAIVPALLISGGPTATWMPKSTAWREGVRHGKLNGDRRGVAERPLAVTLY